MNTFETSVTDILAEMKGAPPRLRNEIFDEFIATLLVSPYYRTATNTNTASPLLNLVDGM